MRRILSVVIVMTFVGLLFAQEATRHYVESAYVEPSAPTLQKSTSAASADKTGRRRVDFMADVVRPYNNIGGDSIVYFVGNFAAHHNGAVITCDSAVRFADTRWGFFGRVLVNQDSIYIYGDSALYDGDASVAEIYAPIIKVIDGDALLYTYNFKFNTEQKIGTYTDGGVLVHDNSIIESIRGYYNADTHDIICVESVEMHGDEYDMKSDSVIYNTDTEFARFFTASEIWNIDGDYLSADEGLYDKAQDLYMVTRNGYILTSEQEMWGDTLEYYRAAGHVIARNNIQMDDFKNKMLAFGDYAEYWQELGDAILTRNPSTISYDLSQSDSIFLRGDTMQMFTISPQSERLRAEMAAQQQAELEAQQQAEQAEEQTEEIADDPVGEQIPNRRAVAAADDRAVQDGVETDDATEPQSRNRTQANARTDADQTDKSEGDEGNGDDGEGDEKPAAKEALLPDGDQADSTIVADSLSAAQQDTVVLTAKQRKALAAQQAKAEARKIKEEERKAKAAARKIELDSIAKVRQAKITEQLNKMRDKELERAAKDSIRRARQRQKLEARGRDVSALDAADSIAALRTERLRQQGTLTEQSDSTSHREYAEAESEVADSLSQGAQGDTVAIDSTHRLVKAYRNVRMFRKDAQMVCDSLVSSSRDSVVHLFIEPVLWNGSNQLAAQKMELYSRNQQLERAEFLENPIMVGQIDTSYYNQVTGKKMIAYFRDNDIYRNDVDGNVQTIYFQREDEKTTLVTEMIYLEGASASFYLENRELTGVTYRNDVPITMYPINQIPATQPMYLPNFKWVPQLRPSLEDVFDRTIRASRRDENVSHRRPTFGIVERMDRRKEQLLLSGEWTDREEDLAPDIIEWRDTRDAR